MTDSAMAADSSLRQATDGDRELMVELLVEGFADDPFFRWLYPGHDYPARAGEYFELVVRRIWPRADGDLLGRDAAAIWVGPDRELAEPDDLAALAELLEHQLGKRAKDVLAAIGSTAPFVPLERHATCVYVAVRRSARGRGLGTQLMAGALDGFDTHGVPAYLTSTNERNMPFYGRLGFRPLADPVPSSGPSLRPMWRPEPGVAAP